MQAKLQVSAGIKGRGLYIFTSIMKGRAGLHVEAAASSSGAHFGVGNVAQLHAHHPEPKGGVLVGHQLQGSNAIQLMQLLCHIE